MLKKFQYFNYFFVCGYIFVLLYPLLKEDYNDNKCTLYFCLAASLYLFITIIQRKLNISLKSYYLLLVICSILFYYFHIFKLVMYLMVFALVKLCLSILEVCMVQSENYPLYKAYGGLGMAIGSIIASYLYPHCYFYLVLGICMIIGYFKIPKVNPQIYNNEFCQIPYYVLFGLFLLFLFASLDQYLTLDKILALHGNKHIISYKWSIQSLAEIPILFIFNKLSEKYKLSNILYFAIFIYALKYFLYGIADESYQIVFIASLQLFSLPLVNTSAKYILKQLTHNNMKIQWYYMLLCNGLALVLAPLLANYLQNVLNLNNSFYLSSIIFILLILYFKINKKANIDF